MNSTQLADKLYEKFHACWTKHVHAPYDKGSFAALQTVVDQAVAYMKEGKLPERRIAKRRFPGEERRGR